MLNIKKFILAAFLLSIVMAVYAAGNRQIFAKIASAVRGAGAPAITNAFIDKEKYFPGETMTITAETENADSAKAMVENERGYNEVNLVMIVKNNGKETWTGKWKVENSLSGKKYKLKIVVSNKAGTAEKLLEWEDPNPGHPWSQIDAFPPLCGGSDYVKGIDPGGTLSCSTPSGGSMAVVSLKCRFADSTAGSCTPSLCPGTWTDAGKGSVIIESYFVGPTSYMYGYTERWCANTTYKACVSLKCDPAGSFCPPPSCSPGWADIGVSSEAIAHTGSDFNTNPAHPYFPYNERWCCK